MRAKHPQMPDLPAPSTMLEPHYSVSTLAELWGYSEDTITRWFGHLPGVLKSNNGDSGKRRGGPGKLSIPYTVAWRVYREKVR